MTLSTDNPAVARIIASIRIDIQRLSEVGQHESKAYARACLWRINGMIDALCVLIGKDHYEADCLHGLAAAAYTDAYNRINARTA